MNKKGFTLIELLAVIIILGILMIIAIPSVTKYINDSRKSSYIDTAKELVGGARNVVNEGKLEMYSTNTTYYIPSKCIKTENGGEAESPYGKFKQAYIGVIYNGQGYKYYWISVDESGQGIKDITPLEKLDVDLIESDLKSEDIKNTVETTGIGNRTEIKILNCNTNSWDGQHHLDNTSGNIPEEGEASNSGNTPANIVCKPATTLHTETCYSTEQYGCNATGQAGNGNKITYGTIPNGTPKAGDAYDCKVKTTGGYTERFYYVTSEGDNSILIYYKNMNDLAVYNYDIKQENWHGPRASYQYLPSISEWNNPRIIAPGTRQIVADNGTTSTTGGTIELFTYTDRAARFLTGQEIVSVCSSITAIGKTSRGGLDACIWLMENTDFSGMPPEAKGYWIETPQSSSGKYVWLVYGGLRGVFRADAKGSDHHGVRPVITIKTSDIEL